MLKIIRADGTAEQKQIADMRSRAAETGESINAIAAAVLKDVREMDTRLSRSILCSLMEQNLGKSARRNWKRHITTAQRN